VLYTRLEGCTPRASPTSAVSGGRASVFKELGSLVGTTFGGHERHAESFGQAETEVFQAALLERDRGERRQRNRSSRCGLAAVGRITSGC